MARTAQAVMDAKRIGHCQGCLRAFRRSRCKPKRTLLIANYVVCYEIRAFALDKCCKSLIQRFLVVAP
jgi:hypothetical protein